ncbi:MAG: hypothetical protein ACUVXG_12205 [Anaerolineae bacterium]
MARGAMTPPPKPPIVRASELNLYGFCPQAWWLGAVCRIPSANRQALAEGAARHQAHAHSLRQALRFRWVGLSLLVLGGLAAAGWLFLSLGR